MNKPAGGQAGRSGEKQSGPAPVFPVGMESPANNLVSSLYATAKRFAGLAINDFVAENWPEFFLHAGTAIEHLAKSRLAGVHPALLMDVERDGAGLNGLLWAVGAQDYFVPSGTKFGRVRTISGTAALKRLSRIRAAEHLDLERLEDLIELRHGAAHLGQGAPSEAGSAIVLLDATVRELHRNFTGRAPDAFFDYLARDVISKARAKWDDVVTKTVADKRARASKLFAQRYGSDPKQLTAIRAAVVSQPRNTASTVLSRCPVCDSQGYLEGSASGDIEVDADVSDGEAFYYGGFVFYLHPDAFRCGVCGLHLTGREELLAGDFPLRIHNYDVDEEDYETVDDWVEHQMDIVRQERLWEYYDF